MSLNDLPAEVILDHLLPELSTRDLFTISRVNREFHALANDEMLWARLTLRDHRYAPTSLAPPDSSSGWSKRVYLGLDSPRLFVWGASDRHRLGISDQVMSGGQVIRRHRNSIDAPAEHPPFSSGRGETWSENLGRTLAAAVGLAESGKREEISRARLVELQSGGWSFTARDAEGGVWVWGTLDGSIISFRSTSWAEPACPVPTPSKIPLPCQAESISSGRNHLLVLDRDNLIWELKAWGRAYHHTSSLLTAPTATGSSRKHIKQISTGWSHSACLSADGEIYVWYPFSADYTGALTPDDQLNDVSRTSDGSAPSDEEDERRNPRGLRWGTVGNIITTLEGLPLRPDLVDESAEVEHVETEIWKTYDENTPEKQKELDQKVVKIASGLDCIIALKANGEVWYRRVKEGEPSSEWEYLPHFSGPTITHLTAQYTTLTTYSSSSIYHTKLPEGRTAMSGVQPTNIQGLQAALGDKRIIQVACGDYHNLALTSTGELYSWGTNDYGQLGIGRTGPAVDNPVKVNFKRTTDEDEGEGEGEAFVFGITAAGHHSGALVLGRGGAKPVVDSRVKSTETISTGSQDAQGRNDHRDSNPSGGHGMPGDWPQTQTGLETQGTFNGVRGMPMFRIGFAGRGASIGGGRLGPGPARQWRPRGGAE